MDTQVEFSAENCIDFAERISQRRLFGSEGHKKVREIIKQTFGKNGYRVKIHEFFATFSEFKFMTFLLLAIILSQLVFVSSYFISPIFNIGLFFVMLVFVKYLVDFASKYDRKASGKEKKSKLNGQNLYATLKSPESNISPIKKKRTIVFMGHYDSISQEVGTFTRIFCFTTLYFSGLINPFIVLLGSVYNLRYPLNFSDIGTMRILYISFILIWTLVIIICCIVNIICFLSTGNLSIGSVDNGTSVSVLIELSRIFNISPPQNVDLMFLCTDAEEIGLLGSKALVEDLNSENTEIKLDRENTYVVNLELLGFKNSQLGLEVSSGIIGKTYTDPELNQFILRAAKDLKIRLAIVNPMTGILSDHIPFLNGGWRSTMLIPDISARRINMIHTKYDTMENVSSDKLKEVGWLCQKLVQTMDADE